MHLLRKQIDRVRRLINEKMDEVMVAIQRIGQKTLRNNEFIEDVRISMITVNYNGLVDSKLMLLTLAECFIAELQSIVVVDNASSDKSWEFFKKLSSVNSRIILTKTPWWQRHHAGGLRWGIEQLERMEKHLPLDKRTTHYLICDNDIIFLRDDFLRNLTNTIIDSGGSLVGEVQLDIGEPYIHPSCALLNREAYNDTRIWPFINSGAPALKLQRSMRRARFSIIDFPVRSKGYIVHKGRGSIARIKKYVPSHAYASVESSPHYHGNPNGQKLWSEKEEQFHQMLDADREDDAVTLIQECLVQGGNRKSSVT